MTESQIFYLYSEKRLKTSSNRRTIAIFMEIVVAEYNSDVRILTGSSEIALCAYAQ